jgi:hypothetical protein
MEVTMPIPEHPTKDKKDILQIDFAEIENRLIAHLMEKHNLSKEEVIECPYLLIQPGK